MAWLLSLVALAAVSAALLAVRAHVDKAHVALLFLLVVLGGSAAGGRMLGITLSVVAFLIFDFAFLPPYYTFVIEDPLDWLILAAFLITGIVAAQLLAQAEDRAATARQRAVEVERLAMLGAETLNVGRAEDALAAIARVIQSTLQVACCEIFIARPPGPTYHRAGVAGDCADTGEADPASLAAWVAQAGAPATERGDRTAQVARASGAPGAPWSQLPPWTIGEDVRALLVPLTVRSRTVGVLRIANETPIALDPAKQQFLDALAYYAALGAERVRLSAEAERAEAFRQAGQLKDALIAGVSHDLRTPLTTIKALAHALVERGESEAGSIESEADRLNRMVADLLDLSRLNAGALPIRLELNVADDLVGAAVRGVSGLPGRHPIVVHAESPGIIGAVCDAVQAVRVLVNLLDNACKYSPRGSPVDLAVRRNGNRVEFAVADRGPGIPPEERERVFTAFYRPPGTPPDVGGAGLGLAIARRLAEAQGGGVRIDARPGGGSVFVFDLPAAEVPVLDALRTP